MKILYENKASVCSSRTHFYPCTPPFTNIMKTAKISVSNTCGNNVNEIKKVDNVCKYWKYYYTDYNTHNNQICPECDNKSRKTHYSVENLRDSHILTNQTCWWSGPLLNKENENFVNITLDFNKKFEIYYIALQFCSDLPDSIEIHKSNDYGFNWEPWQYYSRNCQSTYNMKPIDEYSLNDNKDSRPLSISCIDLNKKIQKSRDESSEAKRLNLGESILPFSPTLHRQINDTLVDWITVTNIRIRLTREISKNHYDYSKYIIDQFSKGQNVLNESYYRLKINQEALKRRGIIFGDFGDDKLYYGLSDLSVGGRCQCNGHGNTCIIDDDDDNSEIKNGGNDRRQIKRIRCVCDHHTTGVDCEKCSDGFQDRPWARANRVSANECKRCHCNLHSQVCKFSKTVFFASRGRSGGVCHKCLHNTAGRHCHYCQNGYHRDWSKPLSHENACIKCKCHGIGSKNSNLCDKKTGQCFCKTGVTGKSCDRCQNGYRETGLHTKPCRKKYKIRQRFVGPPPDSNKIKLSKRRYDDMANTESECKPCDEKRKRIRLKKFCRRNGVFMGTVQSKEVHGKMVRFEIQVKQVWRLIGTMMHEYIVSPTSSSFSTSSTTTAIWLNHDDVRCGCPNIHLGVSYLLLTRSTSKLYRGRPELRLDDGGRSVVLRWHPNWSRRLKKFSYKASRGMCERFKNRKSKISKKNRLRRRRRLRKLRKLRDRKV